MAIDGASCRATGRHVRKNALGRSASLGIEGQSLTQVSFHVWRFLLQPKRARSRVPRTSKCVSCAPSVSPRAAGAGGRGESL